MARERGERREPDTGLHRALDGRPYAWLARRLNPPVAESTVSRWARGEWAIPAGRVDEIAALLRVPREAILAGTPRPPVARPRPPWRLQRRDRDPGARGADGA